MRQHLTTLLVLLMNEAGDSHERKVGPLAEKKKSFYLLAKLGKSWKVAFFLSGHEHPISAYSAELENSIS